MALLQSASDLARRLFAEFQQKAAPAARPVVQPHQTAGLANRIVPQIKPLVQQAIPAINTVGRSLGNQPLIPRIAPLNFKTPTLLQTAQAITPLVGGKRNSPLSSFLSGQVQKIPSQIQSNAREGYQTQLLSAKKNLTPVEQQKVNNYYTNLLPVGGIKAGRFTPEVEGYLANLSQAQKTAAGKQTAIQKGKSFLSDLKSQIVDSNAPIEDVLTRAEKKGKFNVRPTNDVRLQIDRVLRSKSLASQFAQDNGLADVIKNAPDLDALDQYMIAKQGLRVNELGKKTGRNTDLDKRLIQELGPQYEQFAQQVNQYSRKLLDYSVNSGLIDKSLAKQLVEKYPDYVPLNRIFSELEQNGYQGATKSIANLSRQTVVQKLKGSEREIRSPLESLLLKTQTAFEQGEKNVAARQLASYKDLPGFEGLIRPLKSSENAVHKFSYVDNGVKKSFATTPEIASAAKNLDQQQMNILTKIIQSGTRTLQLGATALNPAFAITNLAKDQMTLFINSNKAARSSLLNPENFLRSFFSAVKHDELYDEVIRNAGISTSFDVTRKEADLAIDKLRANKDTSSKIAYTVKNPQELVRALENIIGRTEEISRIQSYRGTYQSLTKEGRTPEDARLLAAKAARNNTANFARGGSFGKVLNYAIPFFNAGIQGSRSFVNAAKGRPVETGAKFATTIGLPLAAATLWNTTDPKRKQIYDDIPEYEKQNNIIFIPDGATKDKNDRYNVIKIPLPPGLSNLGTIVRRTIETTQGADPIQAQEILSNVVAAGTGQSFNTGSLKEFGNSVASNYTPQIIKPIVESTTNTNLFTGLPIVPDSMKNLPSSEQYKDTTSATAKGIGKLTGQSPLLLENAVKTSLGGVGSQLLNYSDTGLAATGVIPSDQIGGENPVQNLERRFTKAASGGQSSKEFDTIGKYQEGQAIDSQKRKQAITKVADIILDPNGDKAQKIKLLTAISADKKLLGDVKDELRDRKQEVTSADKAIRSLSTNQRAKYIGDRLRALSKEEKKKLVVQYINKGILTKDVVKELKKQLAQ